MGVDGCPAKGEDSINEGTVFMVNVYWIIFEWSTGLCFTCRFQLVIIHRWPYTFQQKSYNGWKRCVVYTYPDRQLQLNQFRGIPIWTVYVHILFEDHIVIWGQVNFICTWFPEGICHIELFSHTGCCSTVACVVKLTRHGTRDPITVEECN